MGMFSFNTTDTWQIAYTHGHSAMDLLRHFRDVELEYSKNKEKLKSVEHGQAEHLKLIGRQDTLTKDMLKLAGASIILFQGMMEALINHAMESEASLSSVNGGSFRAKWENSLNAVNRPTANFDTYRKDIYQKYRNPLVHPSQIDARTFDDLTAAVLAAGYKEGWEAFRQLYDGLGHPHDANSWQIMCQSHQVPEFA